MTALKLYLIHACNLVAEFISDRIQQQRTNQLNNEKVFPKSMTHTQPDRERERERVLPVAMQEKTICFEIRIRICRWQNLKLRTIRNSCDRFGPW